MSSSNIENAILNFPLGSPEDYSLKVKGIDLWHGTGARRKQSIREKGLQTLDGLLYASTDFFVASCFAMARSKFEGQDAMIVGLRRVGEWDVDPTMFDSVKRGADVPSGDIVKVVTIKRGTRAYEQLREITEMMAIEIEWAGGHG